MKLIVLFPFHSALQYVAGKHMDIPIIVSFDLYTMFVKCANVCKYFMTLFATLGILQRTTSNHSL